MMIVRRVKGCRVLFRCFTEQELPAEDNEILKELENSQLELLKYKDLHLRALAEQDNIRKRLLLEKENEKVYAITHFSKELLEVSDNLSRAMQNTVPESTLTDLDSAHNSYRALVTGVTLTRSLLLETFKKFDIEEHNPVNQKFDPNFHEALFTCPDEEKESDTIKVVVVTGFTLKDRVLRAAKVGVIKNK